MLLGPHLRPFRPFSPAPILYRYSRTRRCQFRSRSRRAIVRTRPATGILSHYEVNGIMNDLSRRELFQALAAAGVGSEVFQRAVAVHADTAAAVTPQLVERAEWVAGLQLSEEDRKTVAGILNGWHAAFR